MDEPFDPNSLPDSQQEPATSNPPEKKIWLTTWQKIIASKFLVISIVAHLLFGAGAAVLVVQQYQSRTNSFKGGPGTVNPSSRALEHKISMAKKKNSMSAPAQAKRITTTGISKVALPEIITMPSATQVTPNKMGGIGGLGSGLGVGGMGGSGGGAGGFALPPMMNDRCSVTSRITAMRANGGDPKAEEAILKGLRWLKQQQQADGSFGQQYPVAMTGLALLSFMGHCERPSSKEFGECVRKAIDFLVSVGESTGKLARGGGNEWAYEHGIGTYALGEAYILTKEPKIAETFKKAITMIVYGQGSDGGWMYGLNKAVPSDLSVSGWQVQALKTAHLSGLNINGVEDALKKSAENILRCRGPRGGFGYRGPEDKWSLSGVGVLVLQIVNKQRDKVVRQALDFIIEDKTLPKLNYDSADANLYAWYYSTQACFQYGGSAWGKWNRQFQPEILNHQNPDGSWKEPRGGGGGGFSHEGTGTNSDAQVYRSSLCILMLEVYYRYLASSKV